MDNLSNQEKLSARFELVLRVLIDEHIKTGAPVGSRTISKRLGRSISAATVRNLMQDLEEMGFVRQPHTSAGRVPTTTALRYYIRHIMKPKRIAPEEERAIEKLFIGEFSDILQLLEGLGKILATLSDELGLIVAPAGEELILHRIEIIPISSTRVVMVLVTKSGLTRSIMMEIPIIPPKKLEMLKERLNQRLSGLKFSEIRSTIAKRLSDLERMYGSFTTKLIQSVEEIFKIEDEIAILFGRENIIRKPEFADQERLQQVLELCEESDELIKCLPQSLDSGVEILISPPQAMQLGIVVASYPIGASRGMLGVIGPTRMDYPRLVELVSFASNKMAEIWKPSQ